jgi:hypothetical protein
VIAHNNSQMCKTWFRRRRSAANTFYSGLGYDSVRGREYEQRLARALPSLPHIRIREWTFRTATAKHRRESCTPRCPRSLAPLPPRGMAILDTVAAPPFEPWFDDRYLFTRSSDDDDPSSRWF